MVHPDVNPQDPLANEKTRLVIAAYERVTSAKYRDENARYHDELQAGFITIRFAAFGDQITATQSTDSSGGMYIGCYSGESYAVKNDGAFTRLHTCQAPIRSIREAGRIMYLVTDGSCEVMADGRFVARFAHAPGFARLVWGRDSIMEITTKRIRLFSLQGSQYACLDFRDNISDAYLQDDQLKVVTASKIYAFLVQAPPEKAHLDDTHILKPQGNSEGREWTAVPSASLPE